jgi:hypothetical protein
MKNFSESSYLKKQINLYENNKTYYGGRLNV